MSNHIITPNWFVELSDQEQEMFSGGQSPITSTSSPITPLKNAQEISGSETELGSKNIRGRTTSGPQGSFGDSSVNGSATDTGARDLMILPPFIGISQTL